VGGEVSLAEGGNPRFHVHTNSFCENFLKRACMFDALIEYALCGSQPRDESK
jgi:hypothetical protein